MRFDSVGLAKPTSLLLLAVQNFTYGILLPITRRPDVYGNLFFAPSSVVAMELMKIIFTVVGLFTQTPHHDVSGGESNDTRYQPLLVSEDSSVEVFSEKDKSNNVRDSTTEEEDEEKLLHMSMLTDRQGSRNKIVSRIQLRYAEAREEVFTAQALRMCFPAILYVIQNNLQMFSGGYLTATEFQVLSQLKLVSTAFFSVLLLGTRLSKAQWASITLLFIGTATVQASSYLQKQAAIASNSAVNSPSVAISNVAAELASNVKNEAANTAFLYGTVAICLACLCSGLAGVLIEMQLKRKTCFWVTNLHLSLFSIIPALVPLFTDAVVHNAFDPFRYFTALVWTTIFVNAIGGILVTMVLKFADNILKGFAVCAALLATVFYNAWESGLGFSLLQFFGALMVASSTVWYANSTPPKTSTTSTGAIMFVTTDKVIFSDEQK